MYQSLCAFSAKMKEWHCRRTSGYKTLANYCTRLKTLWCSQRSCDWNQYFKGWLMCFFASGVSPCSVWFKILSTSEQTYAQIEKNLRLLFLLVKSSTSMSIGSQSKLLKIMVHQELALTKKNLNQISPRLHKMVWDSRGIPETSRTDLAKYSC